MGQDQVKVIFVSYTTKLYSKQTNLAVTNTNLLVVFIVPCNLPSSLQVTSQHNG